MEHSIVYKLQNKLATLVEYVTPYLPFLNSHMVNFITHDHWNKYIPNDVRSEIELMGYDAFMHIFRNVQTNTVLPKPNQSSTEQFLKEIHKMRSVDGDICLPLEEFRSKLMLNEFYYPLLGVQKIMSHKKTHEVNVASAITNFLCKSNRTIPYTVVDIGGGKGYLSSLLAMEYHLNVLGIDSNIVTTQSAAKRNNKLQKYWTGISRKDVPRVNADTVSEKSPALYKQITQFVDDSTNLKSLLQDNFPNLISGICMTGLHTCGNLATSSLRIYTKNTDIKAILNIGCCYHLIDEEFVDDSLSKQNNQYGFPMSKFLRDQKFCLGRNARMLSSQSIDRRIHLNETLNKSLLYRALLQLLLKEQNLDNTDIQIGRIGAKCTNFKEYIQKVVEKLELEIKLSDEETENILKTHEKDWFLLQMFHDLKMSFAPILELIIILDRYLYLLENGYSKTYLVKLFDPVISPRCYGIISIK